MNCSLVKQVLSPKLAGAQALHTMLANSGQACFCEMLSQMIPGDPSSIRVIPGMFQCPVVTVVGAPRQVQLWSRDPATRQRIQGISYVSCWRYVAIEEQLKTLKTLRRSEKIVSVTSNLILSQIISKKSSLQPLITPLSLL